MSLESQRESSSFRSLCVNLLDCLEKADWPPRYRDVFGEWAIIARTALAEPVAERVTLPLPEHAPDEHPPSSLDRREVAAWYHGHGCGWQAARAALAEPVASSPSSMELSNLWDACNSPSVFARAVPARWGNHSADASKMVTPAEGEVAELVAWLRLTAGSDNSYSRVRLTRAAELLAQAHSTPPAPVPVPVPVSDRPWEREGWCDKEGRFWAEHISRSGVASWRFAAASDLGGWAFRCLPFHALPLPAPQGGEVQP